ncbi:MAG TPA: PQQ-binding-like beta-propeller repeat protein [Methylomirabilota bacterium]|nr:PQQ-binding-like beta-propeller repeat protein [Methylomirabilota bacterium]
MSAARRAASATALAAVVGLAGCGGDSPLDSLKSVNPFKQEEQLLPGERRSVLIGNDPIAETTNQPARIGAAVARSDWPQAAGNASNDSGNIAGSLSGGRVWSVRAGEAEGASFGVGVSGIRVSARPVAANGLVYVYDPAGNVSAHALANGGAAWRVNVRPQGETASVSGGGIAVDGGRVYAATGFREAVALDAASGARAWTTRISAPARGAPTAAAGKVFVVGQDGVVTALEQATGEIAWTATTTARGAGLLASASPAVSGNTVVVPTTSGDILAFDVATGKQSWGASVIGGSRQAAVTGLRDASASPVVSDGVVFATGVGGRTIAVALSNGETVWQQTIGGAHTPVVSGNAVFIVDLEDRLVAFDRAGGSVLWATRLPTVGVSRANWAGPLLIGGRLWLVSADGTLVSADAATGQVGQAGSIGVDGAIPPISAGGRLLALGAGGTLVAIN